MTGAPLTLCSRSFHPIRCDFVAALLTRTKAILGRPSARGRCTRSLNRSAATASCCPSREAQTETPAADAISSTDGRSDNASIEAATAASMTRRSHAGPPIPITARRDCAARRRPIAASAPRSIDPDRSPEGGCSGCRIADRGCGGDPHHRFRAFRHHLHRSRAPRR